ncbi:hypothetical protein RCL_jg13892.t1 [Rhizophagus clarus]|uniref:Uncharacterized protein n=1 Tax=Rhizophagus clarus TaxID=94130 RepID=A0A8H3LUR7_9GLOM|nr:hypothetical protein RCL_jg13892.t1 [Rhizophagus clarus]
MLIRSCKGNIAKVLLEVEIGDEEVDVDQPFSLALLILLFRYSCIVSAILIFPQSSRHIDDVAVNVTVLANGVNLKKDKIYVDTYYDSSNLTSEGGREDRGNMEGRGDKDLFYQNFVLY